MGDLIDRGPKQLATVDLVRRMVEAGARMAFAFRDAVKPSVAAAGETPVSHAPENKHPSACGCTERARHTKLLRWLRFEAKIQCTISVTNAAGPQTAVVKGYGINHGQVAKDVNWQEAFDPAFDCFTVYWCLRRYVAPFWRWWR